MLDATTITLYPELCRYNASKLSFKTWQVWFSSQLSSPRRVMVTFPVIPVDSISIRWVHPIKPTIKHVCSTGKTWQYRFKFSTPLRQRSNSSIPGHVWQSNAYGFPDGEMVKFRRIITPDICGFQLGSREAHHNCYRTSLSESFPLLWTDLTSSLGRQHARA